MVSDKHSHNGALPSTRLPVIRDAGDPRTSVFLPALNILVGLYRPALLAHVRSRLFARNAAVDWAEDVLHDFFEQKLVNDRRVIRDYDKSKGKFRTFVLTALDRFTVSWLRRRAAGIRQPKGGFAELDDNNQLPAVPPVHEGDEEWARIVISEALKRVQAECEHAGQAAFWGIFESRFVNPILEGTKPPNYESLVRRFGFESPSQASNALLTAKRRFKRAVEAVIKDYALGRQETGDELADLRAILAAAND